MPRNGKITANQMEKYTFEWDYSEIIACDYFLRNS